MWWRNAFKSSCVWSPTHGCLHLTVVRGAGALDDITKGCRSASAVSVLGLLTDVVVTKHQPSEISAMGDVH